MHIDDLILSLTKMGYKKGASKPDGDGGLYFSWPPNESSFISYLVNENVDEKFNEWLVDVKPDFVFDNDEEFQRAVLRFYCLNGNLEAYVFSDTRNDDDFSKATNASSIESIGDLAFLINSTFYIAVNDWVRGSHAR